MGGRTNGDKHQISELTSGIRVHNHTLSIQGIGRYVCRGRKEGRGFRWCTLHGGRSMIGKRMYVEVPIRRPLMRG